MHNLHLVRVKANSGEEACREVEILLEDFGNDDNWKKICGAVGKDGEVYEDGGGRWSVIEDGKKTTIKDLNEIADSWIHLRDYQKKALEKALKMKEEERGTMDWYAIQKWAELKGQTYILKGKVDVLKDTFFEGRYDENGITDLQGEGKKTYIVLIDMHS